MPSNPFCPVNICLQVISRIAVSDTRKPTSRHQSGLRRGQAFPRAGWLVVARSRGFSFPPTAGKTAGGGERTPSQEEPLPLYATPLPQFKRGEGWHLETGWPSVSFEQ